jgi:ParB-like chromosome segregation protein Spo0J
MDPIVKLMNAPEITIVADQIEMIPTDDLRCKINRVKLHSADQVAQIAGLMVEFGWTVPMLITKDNEIVAGKGRWLAAKSLGVELCPCVRTVGLSDAQIRALIIIDNKVSESPWDIPELKIELGALKDLDESLLGLTAFDFSEIDALLNGALTDDADDGPELPKVHFLAVGGHKIELTPEENSDLTSLFSEWSKHHGSYRGLAQNLIDAIRNYQ